MTNSASMFLSPFALSHLFQFPMTALTDDHMLGALKQHTFIILQFWSSEVWNGTHWTKIIWSSGCACVCVCMCACVFSTSIEEATPISLILGLLPSLKSASARWIVLLFITLLPSPPLLLNFQTPFTHKDSSGYNWVHPDNPRIISPSQNL